jgi:beta-barrel assembly-enhancing protease
VNRLGTHASGTAVVLLLAVLMTGCAAVTEYGTTVAQTAGVLTSGQADSIKRTAAATEKTFRDITPEQEYYIGRSVAATVLATYKPYDRPDLNHYVNVLGQSLTTYADKPRTFGGYHFLVLETDEVNAFAAPGGLILVSRGLLRCTQNEDELASVLAHEIGHVQNEDGLRAIKTGRINTALTVLAVEAGKNLGGHNLGELTKAFEGSIKDISSTLMNSGYSRSLEYQADATAVKILARAGYDPHALVNTLTKMQGRLAHDSRGFGQTHPAPEARIESLNRLVGAQAVAAAPPPRQQRFTAAMAGLN